MADAYTPEYRVPSDNPYCVALRVRDGRWVELLPSALTAGDREDVQGWTRLFSEVDYNVMRDAVTDLGGVVQAACEELGIHHDTTPAEVVKAIREARRG